MVRRFLLAALLFATAFRAVATDYTDIWFNHTESGWGVNVVQSDALLFVTFFIFGADNKATWYVATVTRDGSGNFNGQLFATTGTYFGAPWNPADTSGSTQVGTASFQPTSAYTANLIYAVNGGPTVVKAIERQALTSIPLGATYSGSQAGAYSNCTSSANNSAYSDRFDLGVTHVTGSTLTLAFNYQSLSCTLSGTLAQRGQLFLVPTATYQCSDGLSTTATVSEIKKTAFGIEGTFGAPDVGGGCREDATFSAVFLSP
jgi:hypothetical protein